MSLHRLLNHAEGIEVVGEAADGEEAIQLIHQLEPNVLLLDIEMPKLDGIEVTQILRKEGSPVKILILSAYDGEEYVRIVIDQGVSGYLTKGESPTRIIEAIQLVASGKKVPQKELYGQGYRFSYQGFTGI